MLTSKLTLTLTCEDCNVEELKDQIKRINIETEDSEYCWEVFEVDYYYEEEE